MLERGEIVEHRTGRLERWLRARRVRVALWIAVIEGLLVVLHVIWWPVALIVAAAVLLIYFRQPFRSGTAGEVAWIAAVSQALVALVPVLLIIVGTLALIAVAALAIVALVVLFSGRR